MYSKMCMTISVVKINYNKSGEFKMTHQATAIRFSLFSRLAPVVSRILRFYVIVACFCFSDGQTYGRTDVRTYGHHV